MVLSCPYKKWPQQCIIMNALYQKVSKTKFHSIICIKSRNDEIILKNCNALTCLPFSVHKVLSNNSKLKHRFEFASDLPHIRLWKQVKGTRIKGNIIICFVQNTNNVNDE